MSLRRVPDSVRRRIPAPRSGPLLWRLCCDGREPAESLDWRDREDLVADLIVEGWSTVEIATLTRMTCYTTDRIIQCVARRPIVQAGAA